MAEPQPTQPHIPQRHHPAHPPPVRRHNVPVIVHVTVCTADRRELLANPVRKGLVERSEDWPYQGKMNELPWIL